MMPSQHRHHQFQSIGEFFAYALELEHESANRYHQLADSMEVHHNKNAEILFRRLAIMSEEHANRIAQRTEGMSLPHIPPWELTWNCPHHSGTDCLNAAVNYLITPPQALELALFNEQRGYDFYAQVADTAHDTEIAQLAEDMKQEEAEHLALLRDWLVQEQQNNHHFVIDDDFDPPNSLA
jgi:rubrerythrin